ncbi:Carbohydrate diacid regulator [Paenibacillus sp. JJ-100]|uniref:CdaR family transcriptional regulator n=1 Tax=Paenibacillus sp. JJ-100 TaxID=2974896 RepID=UPI0022FFAC3D|nr:sugar diacid recognition domain-containing protein [Paenibacillus sp. JJ-100]CAI6080200.1 Carbohydrate diacid regulator [Paenibacillus sp. JJ-100]
MLQLSEKQAQDIVDKMMQDIPYNINIMNEQGIIIGSGQRERVGTVHQGAVRALRTGKMIEVWQDGRLERMGTNEPILINQQHVGVIGISGHPDEVRPFCNIVRTTVALLIEQRVQLESQALEASQQKAFWERLLNHTGSYSQKFCKEAKQYQIDLQLPSVLLYMKPSQKRAEEQAGMQMELARFASHLPSFPLEGEEQAQLILIQNDADIKPTIQLLMQLAPNEIWIGVSQKETNIATGYAQARSVIQILQALQPAIHVMHYEDVPFLVQFSIADLNPHTNTISKLEDSADLLETLRSFIHHSGSMSATADHLNIHRNTLQYRLKRIHTLTGRDPRNWLELIELTHGLLRHYQ